MLLKLLWIIVIAWIAHRVWLAGRHLVLIAMGREGVPLGGGRPDPERRDDRPSQPSASRSNRATPSAPENRPSDVEDARWVDL